VPDKLLIADDSTTIQKVFERTFPPTEFILSFAVNGEEALAKAKTERPQVLIADINMPVKNGFEVCEAVKNDPALQGMPVLLLVGILDDFDEDESRRVGADGFIVKPFEASAALNKVREALKKGGTTPAQMPAGRQKEQEAGMPDFLKQTAPSPSKSLFEQQGGEEVVELSEVVEEPPLEFADFLKESPAGALPAGVPPASQAIEDILRGSPNTPASPPRAAKEDDLFVLQSPLRDLEAELKAEFPEEPEAPPAPAQATARTTETLLFSETEQDESWSLELDLPFDTLETEPRAEGTDWTKMFNESSPAGPGQEIKDERLGAILGESATELERIDDLGATRPQARRGEEEFAGKFMDSYEPVFEREGDEQHIELKSPDLTKGAGDLAEQVAAAVRREMKTVVEEAIKEQVPRLVRQILEQSKKE
jgi:CheY-like chemotaxis protein